MPQPTSRERPFGKLFNRLKRDANANEKLIRHRSCCGVPSLFERMVDCQDLMVAVVDAAADYSIKDLFRIGRPWPGPSGRPVERRKFLPYLWKELFLPGFPLGRGAGSWR